ncbi:hypothetical protein BS50DRAFT_478707 [Corynespora cassiicola Philippines]|uniref:Ubiquitin-like domain-containing protein n=1 Tax=Corynespora cassiicola Philippines TaxID=1448308 RepID=A0A2T2PBU2_CORCC|nr:hypothetical protein BS50DRAFT_478707 [Corynespora cassiicola Philippines]
MSLLGEVQDATKPGPGYAPLRFKDAVGRKFMFPWHLCKTWKGIEDLIKQAFLHVEVLGPHVLEGHYDLVASDGEIILPQVWETMIEPGMAVTMHMWPMPESLPAKESSIESGTSSFTQSTLQPILSPSSKIEDFDSKSKPEMPVMSARSSPRLLRSPPLSPIFSISLENLKNSPLVKVAEVANSDIPPLNLADHISIENSPHLSAVDHDWLNVDDCNV